MTCNATVRQLITRSLCLGLLGALVFAPAASAAAQTPVIGAFYADRGVEPTRFSPDPSVVAELSQSADLNNFVRSITWSSWGKNEAVGSGQVSLLDGNDENYDSPPAMTSPVTVRLSGLKMCLGLPTYTSYALTLAPGAQSPTGWPKGQAGTFQCETPRHSKMSRHPLEGCWQGLQMPRPSDEEGSPQIGTAPWRPKLPAPGLTVLCSTQIPDSGGAVATGTGIRENLTHGVSHGVERNWPATFVLSRPVWCPTVAAFPQTNTYSQLRVRIYGPPRVPNKRTLSSWGHHGLPVTGVGMQQFRAGSGCRAGVSWVNPIPAE